MASPINSFEAIESIRFFAQLVSTEAISERAKDMCNEYIEKLLEALLPSVREITASASGLKLIK